MTCSDSSSESHQPILHDGGANQAHGYNSENLSESQILIVQVIGANHATGFFRGGKGARISDLIQVVEANHKLNFLRFVSESLGKTFPDRESEPRGQIPHIIEGAKTTDFTRQESEPIAKLLHRIGVSHEKGKFHVPRANYYAECI